MKKIIFVSIILLFSSISIFSQFMKGDFELVFTTDIGYENYRWEEFDHNIALFSNSENSVWYMFLFIQPSYYIIDNLAIQPEIGLNALEKNNLWKSVIINLKRVNLVYSEKLDMD